MSPYVVNRVRRDLFNVENRSKKDEAGGNAEGSNLSVSKGQPQRPSEDGTIRVFHQDTPVVARNESQEDQEEEK